MHIIFIPYGCREWVERFLRQIESQWGILPMNKGNKKINVPFKFSIRTLPLGAYEVIFPKEYINMVLTTLSYHGEQGRFCLSNLKLNLLRKVFMCDKISSEFDKSKKFLWYDEITDETVNVLLIGIREDGEITEPEKTKYSCFSHEAI